MRVTVVVAAMLFCTPVFAQGVKLKSVPNSIGMELVEIPAGDFMMGSPAGEKDRQVDEAQRLVTLTKPFKLGKYEVTQGQWKKVMGKEPWLNQVGVQISEDYPATYVNWGDATEFCKKLTAIERKSGTLKANEKYRLPTEAEWEYACRAGTKTAFSFGNDESNLGEYAWFIASLVREPYAHKVGLKKPNPWGLHDMHGNVLEWCSGGFGLTLLGGTDPIVPEGSVHVSRGGGWTAGSGICRSANRSSLAPAMRFSFLGFRVARSQSVQ